MIVVTY